MRGSGLFKWPDFCVESHFYYTRRNLKCSLLCIIDPDSLIIPVILFMSRFVMFSPNKHNNM